MKLKRDDDGLESITFPDGVRPGKREVCLFNALKEVGFFRDNEGPAFTIDELRELLPHLQRAVENNSFEIPPKYELVELCEDTFVIRKIGTDRFYDRYGDWACSVAALFSEKSAEIMLAHLEKKE